MATKGEGDGVGGGDLYTVGGLAAPSVDIDVGQRAVGAAGDPRLEGGLVDEDVDHRLRWAGAGHGGGGTLEDRSQGVEAALGGGPFEHRRCRIITEPLSQFGPVGVELGLLEAAQDLGDRGAVDHPTVGVQPELVTDDRGVRRPAVVGSLVTAVGAVDIGERFPALHTDAELQERQMLGVIHQGGDDVDDVGTDTRVRPGSCQLADLGDAEPAG